MFAGVLVVLLTGTAALFSYFSEPRYNGRQLSYWLMLYHTDFRQAPEAQHAIRAIGTNAVPTLIRLLYPGERTFSVARLLSKTDIPIELIEDNSKQLSRVNFALYGFRLLGPTASNAIPTLLADLENPQVRYLASDALQSIGAPAFAPVQQLLTSTNTELKQHAVHIILGITRRDSNTVARLLQHTDPFVRGETYLWLRTPRQSPEEILSTLLDGLRDPESYVACRAAIAIRGMELEHVTNTLPRLYEFSATTNALVATEITSTIKNIEKRIRIEQTSPPRRFPR